MKKIISIFAAALFASTLAFGITACNNETAEGDTAPITFNYERTEAKDGEGTDFFTLTGVTVSEEAKTFIDKNDYEGLANLFNTSKGGYTAPETKYDKDTVREFVIPAEYENLPVKEIAAEAIVNQTFIKKLVVGDNVKKIEKGAFSGLTELETVELPFVGGEVNAFNSAKSFGYIFGTTSLTGLTGVAQTYNDGASGNSETFYIPATLKNVVVTGDNTVAETEVKYNVDEDGKYVFTDDGEYTVTVDDSKYAVSPYAFYGCSMITSVTLTGSIETIGNYTFYGCTSLKEYIFGDDTATVGDHAFDGCTSLRNVDFNNVETIGDYAFNGCTSLGKIYETEFNDVTIGAEKIGEFAFNGCTSLDKVVFTAETLEIGYAAFMGETSLREIEFGGKTVLKDFAFAGCTKIQAVDLANVEAIGDSAFYNCTNLKTVRNLKVSYGNAFEKTKFAEEDL